ncbi:MAG: helix-turn-helix domain-containing protein [Kiritimatiellae bacterium]|nr:helix-turn-helix domain-containing protein [Kiritimatiellia bacterium]
METMGQVFKSARERKRISLPQAAVRTRIKLQHLEMMERDDYSKMPAPTYARGFIRMYADFLGLEAGPLVEEYDQLHQPGARSRDTSARAKTAEPPRVEQETSEPGAPADAPRRSLAAALTVLSPANLKRAAVVLGLILVCWLLVVGVSRCAREAQRADNDPHSPVLRKGVPAVVQEPSDPYLPLPASSGETR